jgi:ABC-type nickel/cobalt efflux system permease component RcnA
LDSLNQQILKLGSIHLSIFLGPWYCWRKSYNPAVRF